MFFVFLCLCSSLIEWRRYLKPLKKNLYEVALGQTICFIHKALFTGTYYSVQRTAYTHTRVMFTHMGMHRFCMHPTALHVPYMSIVMLRLHRHSHFSQIDSPVCVGAWPRTQTVYIWGRTPTPAQLSYWEQHQ